jgi:PHP family Zn ribbon phosphoesterase
MPKYHSVREIVAISLPFGRLRNIFGLFMGEQVSGHNDKLRERFEKAEGQILKDNYREVPKRKWLKTRCPHCKYELGYSPAENFHGNIRCPQCGKSFHITRLDDFED